MASSLSHRRNDSRSAWVLVTVFSLLVSCDLSSNQILGLNPFITPTPSPTPFQPELGVYDSPFAAPLFPQAMPTFTPYPTIVVEGGQYPTAVQVVPPPQGSLGYSLITPANPLTGLPPADPALLDRRPLAVKIANYPRYVRPQSGLTLADVVFEYYIEDLLTRFIAIFYGNDAERAGPVRSGRYFDEHITRMYHAFYVFKYADPREYTYFKGGDLEKFMVVPGFGACPPFFNGKRKIESYNNVFFNTAKWKDCVTRRDVDNARPPLRSGFFSVIVPSGAPVVNRIYTRYSVDDYNYWEYDASTGKYIRYQETDDTRDGKPEAYAVLMDDLTGLPVTANNVIVLFAPHIFDNRSEAEDEVYHIDLVNSGEAYVFRDGFAFPVRWYRRNTDQPLLIASETGTPIYLRPGVTFYQVIGETSTSWSDGTDWHFEFQTP